MRLSRALYGRKSGLNWYWDEWMSHTFLRPFRSIKTMLSGSEAREQARLEEEIEVVEAKYKRYSVNTIWKHRSEEDIDDWYTLDDNMYGGRSLVELGTGKGGRLQMKGVIDGTPSYNQPDANPWENVGFAGIRSYGFGHYWGNTKLGTHSISVGQYDQFEIRCRGDGRSYRFQLHFKRLVGIEKADTNYIHRAVLHTRGGPYWERVFIPYNRFFACNRAQISEHNHPMPDMTQLYSISIFPDENLEGDFNLEIDSIRVVASCSQDNKSHPPEIMKWQMHEFDQLDQLKFGQYKKSKVYSKQDHVLW